MNLCIANASAVFGILTKSVLVRSSISLSTKLKVFSPVIIPNILYACRTLSVYNHHARKLNHFHFTHLCELFKISWKEISNTEVLTWAQPLSICTLHRKAQIRWAGHVTRMLNEHLSKKFSIYAVQEEVLSPRKNERRTLSKCPHKASTSALKHRKPLLNIIPPGMASSSRQ